MPPARLPAPVLIELFCASGLGDIRCEPIEIPTVFTGFDDYWRPLLTACAWAVSGTKYG